MTGEAELRRCAARWGVDAMANDTPQPGRT